MEQTPPPTNRFKAEMPSIPGVGGASQTPALLGKNAFFLAALVVALSMIGGTAWWALRSMGHRAQSAAAVADPLPAAPPAFSPLAAPHPSGPVEAATLHELAKPWAAKEFAFVDPATGSTIPAMVVHLSGGAANASASYWAFSLNAPLASCQLEYISDLSQLVARFSYHGAHPMVVSACDGTVFDPLKMGTIASGAWVRGEIVQGAGIRPPISIEVKVQGDRLIADRIE